MSEEEVGSIEAQLVNLELEQIDDLSIPKLLRRLQHLQTLRVAVYRDFDAYIVERILA